MSNPVDPHARGHRVAPPKGNPQPAAHHDPDPLLPPALRRSRADVPKCPEMSHFTKIFAPTAPS